MVNALHRSAKRYRKERGPYRREGCPSDGDDDTRKYRDGVRERGNCYENRPCRRSKTLTEAVLSLFVRRGLVRVVRIRVG